jgi:cytochrome bd-type quinol oxidase subunit 1
MNYPVWELSTFGGGFLIALIAIVHVLVSHFAVGGGLFLVSLEKKAYREENPALLEYVKKHSKFFLLLTMVFGGLTGVGIWWIISLLNPAATSALIHIFVFGWAAEWVFFLAEIVALFIYFYTFGKMERKKHILIGWIYFFSAWMSLFLINGIIDFMLSPGTWLENQNFWSGFFNPTFWPALVFRTGLSLVLCGVFGFVTAAFVKDQKLRTNLMHTCAKWVAVPFVLMLAGGWWYIEALPGSVSHVIFEHSPEMTAYLSTLAWATPVFFAISMFMALKLPNSLQKILCFVVVGIALIYFGAFEFVREGGRRPYIIYEYMYSNQVYADDIPAIQQAGFLSTAKWTEYDEITQDNLYPAGKDLFKFQCSACHSVGGPLNNILPLVEKYSNVFGMDSKLNGLGKLNTYMPPFMGTREERWALASYIVKEFNNSTETSGNIAVADQSLPVEIPPFDKDKDEYVLLAWSTLGMKGISDNSAQWMMLPPGTSIYAQLIKRGNSPSIVTREVELRYNLDEEFLKPQDKVEFWNNVEALFGKKLEPGVGLKGMGLAGTMRLDPEHNAFVAPKVPVLPYPESGGFNPYPLMTVTAVDRQSGKELARTRVVAPATTEMGCRNCHGGDWRVANVAGFTMATGEDILAAHDKNSATSLVQQARDGKPVLCQSCHADPVLGAPGKEGVLNFSASIHGWHANFLTGRDGNEACAACHGIRDDGPTQCFRSHHGQFMECSNCHGTMEDHSLTLLKYEEQQGKERAAILMEHLQSRNVDSVADIQSRAPWTQQPDCLNCHENFGIGMSMDAFNVWTEDESGLFRNRHDQMGAVMCAACHSSPHAVYPATFNRLGEKRDSIQPLQYQGNNRPIGNDCMVCHTVPKQFEAHHPNSLRN